MAQVEIQPGIDYGPGWMTGNYKGQRHGRQRGLHQRAYFYGRMQGSVRYR